MIDNLIYLFRYALWNKPTIRDFRKFPQGPVANGDSLFTFKKDASGKLNPAGLLSKAEYRYRKEARSSSLKELLASTGTTSFIIVKDEADKLLLEIP